MYRLKFYSTYRCWYLNQNPHRAKGPAEENLNGHKEWWFKGRLHRDNNLPAVEHPTGEKEYWINGQEYFLQENGTREFYRLGRLNRFYDLPAIEYPNGDKEWWAFGVRHRKDGPAVIYGNKKFWFKCGVFIKCTV